MELHYLEVPLEGLIDRVERRNRTGEWTASPISRADMEAWAATFEAPDADELLLFDEPLVS